MSHYTLGWHDQLNEYHEIGEYAEDAWENIKERKRGCTVSTGASFFFWIQLRRSNERLPITSTLVTFGIIIGTGWF